MSGIGMRKRRQRRLWSDDEKRRIVGQARVSGVSVSQVARRYDVNANLVFKRLRDPRFQAPDEAPTFLPVEVSRDTALVVDRPPARESQVEIELANGHRFSLSGAFDLDRVLRLVRGLAE